MGINQVFFQYQAIFTISRCLSLLLQFHVPLVIFLNEGLRLGTATFAVIELVKTQKRADKARSKAHPWSLLQRIFWKQMGAA